MSTVAYPGLGNQAPANYPDQDTSYQQPARTARRHSDPEDLTLYAIGLLSGEDFANIAQHIEHCSECRRELANIQSDLGAYAFTTTFAEPTPASRERLLKQLSRERKIVPVAPVQEVVTTYSRTASVLRSVPDDDEDDEIAPAPRPIGLVVAAVTGWLAAGALAATAGLIYHEHAATQATLSSATSDIAHLNAEVNHGHQLVAAINDPHAVRVTLGAKPPKAAPAATATYDPDTGTLIFLASNLDPLQEKKVYQLWLIPADGSNPIPGENNPITAGTFRPDSRGNASVLLPELPKGIAAKGFNLSIEDEGSTANANKPVLSAIF